MIPRMISELSDDTKMCLINAVYFKGEWTTVFEVEDTQESDFYGVNGTRTVDMMYQYGNSYKYVEYDGLKGIRLPYGDGQVAMDIWIADEDESRDRNAVDIFNSMTNDARTELFESLDNAPSEEISELALPSFEVETETMNISDALKALGIDKAFDKYAADFDMVNLDLFVSDVLHKAKIKVDESGTEAAAATGIIMETCEAYEEPQEIYTFIADNPFIYVIRDVDTGTILFMGSYVD
jgi:serpin B